MKWVAARVILDMESVDQAVDIVSGLFYDIGLSGVVVDDPEMNPAEGWGEDALPKPSHHAVTGYLPKNESFEFNCRHIETSLFRLGQEHGILSRINYSEVDEEDWAESWKEYFWPEKITDTIVVKPSWREYESKNGEIIIEIDPGMAFGTGTHPTTSMCIQLIQEYLEPGDDFLDIGTGSGILMIAAAKLGAQKLAGIDMDMVACDTAVKNLLLNKVSEDDFSVRCGNLLDSVTEKYDFIAANILSEVILFLLDDILKVTASSGILVCSGIVEANAGKVVDKMKETGFSMIETRKKDGWVAIAGRLDSQIINIS